MESEESSREKADALCKALKISEWVPVLNLFMDLEKRGGVRSKSCFTFDLQNLRLSTKKKLKYPPPLLKNLGLQKIFRNSAPVK